MQRARRNSVLDILREGDDAERFQLMEDCLALLQPLRLLCDRLERRNATLSLVVPAVRETLDAYRNLYSARVLQPPSYEILKHILSKFIAQMAMNVADLCVTASLLSVEGRNEIRARELGFTITDARSPSNPYGQNGTSGHQRDAQNSDDADLSPDQRNTSDSSSSDEELAEEPYEMELDPVEVESEEFTSYQNLEAG